MPLKKLKTFKSKQIIMETMRNFVNSFIAEDDEQFTEQEFAFAVGATIAVTIFLIFSCTFG